MTTKSTKGRITGLIGLTCEAQYAAEKGDAVIVTGDYEVDLADGTKPVLGTVTVANKAPQRGVATRDPEVPGDVTVEALGFTVQTLVSGGAIPAGSQIGYNATGDLVAVALGAAGNCGIALTATTAAGQEIDCLLK